MAKLKWNLVTFGCKVNTYDSGLLQQRLKKFKSSIDLDDNSSTDSSDFVSNEFVGQDEAQIHLLNTCAVTQEATREALRLSRRLKSHYPGSYVVITGCAAQVDTEQFEKESAVDLVVANSHKAELEVLVDKMMKGRLGDSKTFKSNIFKKEDLEAGGGLEDSRTRSFLKIQDGCNSFCTFCVIPFARGKSRSISIENLIEKVLTLESKGVQEVVLTGIHIGDYEDESATGLNGGTAKLEDLVEALLKSTGIQRIRLGSLEPIELTDRLVDLYQDPRMCKHFHMSIQAANTKVLHDMKRKYTSQDVEKALFAIKARYPEAFVGMDVIAGFVGETDEEFEDTYQRLKSLPWTRLHVFPYSERPGTYAARTEVKERAGAINPAVLKHRAERLRELSLERFQMNALAQIGQVKKVLRLKSKKQEIGLGISRDFWHIQGESSWPQNEEFFVKIQGFDSSSRHEGVLLGSFTNLE